jgi:hypothetical protein
MEIPGIGNVTQDNQSGWYYSQPIPIKALGNKECKIVVAGYDEDERKEDFHGAIANFLAIDESVLHAAEEHIFQYYQDSIEAWGLEEGEYEAIKTPKDVWEHINLGDEPLVGRRPRGDRGIYISLECECDWEEEHGLQIVFKNGLKVNKVGPYNGHVTNSDAYGDKNLEDVIYRG